MFQKEKTLVIQENHVNVIYSLRGGHTPAFFGKVISRSQVDADQRVVCAWLEN